MTVCGLKCIGMLHVARRPWLLLRLRGTLRTAVRVRNGNTAAIGAYVEWPSRRSGRAHLELARRKGTRRDKCLLDWRDKDKQKTNLLQRGSLFQLLPASIAS